MRSAAPAAAVRAAARHQRPLRPLLMAETGLWGPCASPTHVRSTAASTVDADIMLSMTSAVARHCISPRCSWDRPAGLVHPDARRSHSHDGTECARRKSGCTRPVVGAYQHCRPSFCLLRARDLDSSSSWSGTRAWHARHRASLVLSRPRTSSPIYTRPGQAVWPLRSAITRLTVTVQ